VNLKDWEKSAAVENLASLEPVKRASLTLRRDQREQHCYPTFPTSKTPAFSGQV